MQAGPFVSYTYARRRRRRRAVGAAAAAYRAAQACGCQATPIPCGRTPTFARRLRSQSTATPRAFGKCPASDARRAEAAGDAKVRVAMESRGRRATPAPISAARAEYAQAVVIYDSSCSTARCTTGGGFSARAAGASRADEYGSRCERRCVPKFVYLIDLKAVRARYARLASRRSATIVGWSPRRMEVVEKAWSSAMPCLRRSPSRHCAARSPTTWARASPRAARVARAPPPTRTAAARRTTRPGLDGRAPPPPPAAQATAATARDAPDPPDRPAARARRRSVAAKAVAAAAASSAAVATPAAAATAAALRTRRRHCRRRRRRRRRGGRAAGGRQHRARPTAAQRRTSGRRSCGRRRAMRGQRGGRHGGDARRSTRVERMPAPPPAKAEAAPSPFGRSRARWRACAAGGRRHTRALRDVSGDVAK